MLSPYLGAVNPINLQFRKPVIIYKQLSEVFRMNFSNFYIKSAQEKLGLDNYSQVRKKIGGTSGHMTEIKNEKRTLTKSQVTEIAKILEIDECIIAAGMMADKAKTKEERIMWLTLIKGYKNLPNSVALDLMLTTHNKSLCKKPTIRQKVHFIFKIGEEREVNSSLFRFWMQRYERFMEERKVRATRYTVGRLAFQER